MSEESSANLRDQINFKAGVDQANAAHGGRTHVEQDFNYLIESFKEFKIGIGSRMEKMEQILIQNATIIATHEANIVNLVKLHDTDVVEINKKIVELTSAKDFVVKIVMTSVIVGLLGMMGWNKLHP